jgi:hypothetical protein
MKWEALIQSYLAVLPRIQKAYDEAEKRLLEVRGEIARLRELQAEEAKEAA